MNFASAKRWHVETRDGSRADARVYVTSVSSKDVGMHLARPRRGGGGQGRTRILSGRYRLPDKIMIPFGLRCRPAVIA